MSPNLRHKAITDFDGNRYVGSMAVYIPEDNDRGYIRLGGVRAQFGDLMIIRGWDSAYSKDNLGSFKVGPMGSVDPKDFRDSVRVEEVFIIPKDVEGLITEYNKLVEAAEELDSRIAWMEALGKAEFSENEYRLDQVMQKIDIEISDEKAAEIRDLIKNSVKF